MEGDPLHHLSFMSYLSRMTNKPSMPRMSYTVRRKLKTFFDKNDQQDVSSNPSGFMSTSPMFRKYR